MTSINGGSSNNGTVPPGWGTPGTYNPDMNSVIHFLFGVLATRYPVLIPGMAAYQYHGYMTKNDDAMQDFTEFMAGYFADRAFDISGIIKNAVNL